MNNQNNNDKVEKMMKSFVTPRRVKIAIKVFLVLGVIAFAVYFMRFSPGEVNLYPVTRGIVVNEVMGTGTLEARVRAAVSPKISGLLTEVKADQNDRVVKGQLLARLDDSNLRRQVELAEAELAAARAALPRLDAEIVAATASAVKARENFERVVALRKGNVIAQNELEQATESHDVAKATLSRIQAARLEAERNIDRAAAALRYAQAQWSDAELRAPFDALVVRRNRNPGDVVVPGGSILDVISLDQLWVSAWVDETAMARLAVGQPAEIVFRSQPEISLPGRVARLGAETDRETREFLVDVDLLQLPANWAVGQRAEVYIRTGRRENVPTIPSQLVLWRNGQSGVLVARDGQARWRPVKLGLTGRTHVEVTEDLKEGESVIGALPGRELPRDGRRVEAVKP